MAQGSTAFSQKQYGPAREQYQKALSFKPDDPAAKNKIGEIDLLLKQEQDRLSAQQALKKQYDEAIARAEKLLTANDFTNSKLAFGEASQLMPGESYPKQKIGEIDKILADQQKALADKQAKDKAYNDAVKNGDMYLSLKNYNDAKSEYNKALSVRPDEVYPKNKLAEIENSIKADQKAMADQKAKEDAYNAAVASGNNAYGQKKYPEAKGFYNQALKIKPDEPYAKDQIVLIDNLLAGMEKQKLADEAKQKQYNDLIAIADKAFDAANYPSAKENYQKALAVIPDSPYPKQKIARIDEINKLLAQQKAATNQSSKKSLTSTAPLTQLNFKDDNERDVYLNDLKKKYPEGVTVEIYKEKYQETRRYIIVRDDIASEFRDVMILSYKGHEYSKNGKTVTQMYFEQQVKSRPGEYYNETTFE
jgi:tetratricopeptide (TPR) repeat protein